MQGYAQLTPEEQRAEALRRAVSPSRHLGLEARERDHTRSQQQQPHQPEGYQDLSLVPAPAPAPAAYDDYAGEVYEESRELRELRSYSSW